MTHERAAPCGVPWNWQDNLIATLSDAKKGRKEREVAARGNSNIVRPYVHGRSRCLVAVRALHFYRERLAQRRLAAVLTVFESELRLARRVRQSVEQHVRGR